MESVMNVANWFIWRVNSDTESGDNITNLKLQKLIYYAQGFSLALNNRPLFKEPIVAWKHGPVVVPVYEAYKVYGGDPLPTDANFIPSDLSDEDRELLNEVFDVYGQYSAWGLRNLTHTEAPWKNVSEHDEITADSLTVFFKEQLVQDE